jgi:hypothetical protein
MAALAARMVMLARKGVRDGRGRQPGQPGGRPKQAPSPAQAAQERQIADRRKASTRCADHFLCC